MEGSVRGLVRLLLQTLVAEGEEIRSGVVGVGVGIHSGVGAGTSGEVGGCGGKEEGKVEVRLLDGLVVVVVV